MTTRLVVILVLHITVKLQDRELTTPDILVMGTVDSKTLVIGLNIIPAQIQFGSVQKITTGTATGYGCIPRRPRMEISSACST